MRVLFNVHNNGVPFCSMRAPRKTCFVSATWKRFLVIKLLLLTCMYPLFVGTFFGLQPCGFILFVYELFISKSKSQVYGILHNVFFFSKQQLKDTAVIV